MSINLDQEKCRYDLSIYYHGKFVEKTAPLYSASELIDHVLVLPDKNLDQAGYWNRMLFFGMQFQKGIASHPEDYVTKYNFWKSKLENALEDLVGETSDDDLKAAATQLGEFSETDPAPEALLAQLMQFINQFHNIPSG